MNEEPSPPRRADGAGRLITVALVVLAIGVGAWRGWVWWQARNAEEQTAQSAAMQRIEALEARTDALRRDQRAQAQRLLDAAATNRVLRDEVLGLGQRGALLEESVAKLTDPNRHGAQALRLDEVELLLSQAAQRLDIARDLDGARRAYALASGTLDGMDDHRLLNLKQTLAQERAALDALGAGTQAASLTQLGALADALAGLPRDNMVDAQAHARPAWQRMLAPLVDVRPTRDTTLVAPDDRATADAALQIEISLARAALERGDAAALRVALARIATWLPRLWPDSPQRRQVQVQLRTLQQAPAPTRPAVLGSTLQQLRALRNAGVRLSVPAANTPEVTP
ncbi:uroporphyrin-3 C-methyltransferase [Pseudoxanthomonas sp. 3HH-4]|uniref:uroporphyrinogen-III C-methyltransferase n=1 Tax=Pseudoxanthomonas sp. 3HH-4 TaxID=1690214 RepID=UPI0011510F32|nr:uroporphyrinogen-III C-methyltransferase [Pseudoxanthomonas sp. 3HH-4]TQM16897.1 uroporphyrin-3 C-methyltransferase [Pseudoxanthomonas sp. 3HH-4]